jgi:DNA-binding IclR family transcriptional regulator
MAGQRSGRGVQSIEVGGRLHDALVQAQGPLMLRDLAERAALTAGQAHAYLVSFRTLGLVEQDAATGLYRLGPYALTLGLARLRWHDPLAVIWESVPAFAESLHLMVTMSIWTDAGPVILRLHEAPFQIYSNIRTGARYSLTQTATGRLFAALMPIDVVQPLVEAELTEARKAGVPDLVAAADYQEALTLIRAEGCSQTEGSPVPDISAIAAPVYDLNEQIVAAITLIGRRGRVACQPGGEHREAVLGFVNHLSQRLGYPTQP